MREIWSDFFGGLFFQERTSKLHFSSEPVQLYGTDIYKDVPSVHLEFCQPCRCHFFFIWMDVISLKSKKPKEKPPKTEQLDKKKRKTPRVLIQPEKKFKNMHIK